jgi:hypothetical protein
MDRKKIAILQIGIALFFASAIIVSSLLLSNTAYQQYSETVTYFLIALWFIPFSWLAAKTNGRTTLKAEYLCFRRMISGLFNRV